MVCNYQMNRKCSSCKSYIYSPFVKNINIYNSILNVQRRMVYLLGHNNDMHLHADDMVYLGHNDTFTLMILGHNGMVQWCFLSNRRSKHYWIYIIYRQKKRYNKKYQETKQVTKKISKNKQSSVAINPLLFNWWGLFSLWSMDNHVKIGSLHWCILPQ